MNRTCGSENTGADMAKMVGSVPAMSGMPRLAERPAGQAGGPPRMPDRPGTRPDSIRCRCFSGERILTRRSARLHGTTANFSDFGSDAHTYPTNGACPACPSAPGPAVRPANQPSAPAAAGSCAGCTGAAAGRVCQHAIAPCSTTAHAQPGGPRGDAAGHGPGGQALSLGRQQPPGGLRLQRAGPACLPRGTGHRTAAHQPADGPAGLVDRPEGSGPG